MIDLDVARAFHQIFIDKLELAALELITPSPSEAVVRDDATCQLGQWLQGDGRRFDGLSAYAEVVSTHKVFHAIAADFIAIAESCHRDLDEMKRRVGIEQASTNVSSAIDKLAAEITKSNETSSSIRLFTPEADTEIPWDPALALGVPSIDTHHQAILKILNKFFGMATTSLDSEMVINGMAELTTLLELHFEVEEAYMRSIGMPANEIQDHFEKHSAILSQFIDLSLRSMTNHQLKVTDVLGELRQATIDHIVDEDQKIKPYLPHYK